MRRAATLLRERSESIARAMTMEQGKPIAEAREKTLAGAELIEWFAEEGRRSYGRVVPARSTNISQILIREPVGPVAAFSPWNFPINQAVRKISAALASGCSIILKGPRRPPPVARRWLQLSPTLVCRPACSVWCSARRTQSPPI